MAGYFDDILSEAPAESGGGFFDDILNESVQDKPVEPRGFSGALKDTAIDAAKGVVGLGESVVGLADIATGNIVGKGLSAIGYDPKETKRILSEGYSDQRVAANKNVEGAKGFVGTIEALIDNPSVAFGSIVESAPMSISGVAAARGVATKMLGTALAKNGIAAGTPEALSFAKTFFGSPAVRKTLVLVGSGAEGAQTAGSIQEQGRQGGRGWGETVLPAVAAGIGTSAIGAASSKIPGFRDAEATLATAGLGGGRLGHGLVGSAGQVGRSIIKEGVLEEMPQSGQEQAWTNVAMGEPTLNGVPEAMGQGVVVGGLQGGGMTGVSEFANRNSDQLQQQAQQKFNEQSTTEVAQPTQPGREVDLPPSGPIGKAVSAGGTSTEPVQTTEISLNAGSSVLSQPTNGPGSLVPSPDPATHPLPPYGVNHDTGEVVSPDQPPPSIITQPNGRAFFSTTDLKTHAAQNNIDLSGYDVGPDTASGSDYIAIKKDEGNVVNDRVDSWGRKLWAGGTGQPEQAPTFREGEARSTFSGTSSQPQTAPVYNETAARRDFPGSNSQPQQANTFNKAEARNTFAGSDNTPLSATLRERIDEKRKVDTTGRGEWTGKSAPLQVEIVERPNGTVKVTGEKESVKKTATDAGLKPVMWAKDGWVFRKGDVETVKEAFKNQQTTPPIYQDKTTKPATNSGEQAKTNSDSATLPQEGGAVPASGEGKSEGKTKEPWEMTGDEFTGQGKTDFSKSPYEEMIGAKDDRKWRFQDVANGKAFHKWNVVAPALAEGKPVPAEVLADYPDLAANNKPAPAATESATDNGTAQPGEPHGGDREGGDGTQEKPASEMTAAELLRAAADKMDNDLAKQNKKTDNESKGQTKPTNEGDDNANRPDDRILPPDGPALSAKDGGGTKGDDQAGDGGQIAATPGTTDEGRGAEGVSEAQGGGDVPGVRPGIRSDSRGDIKVKPAASGKDAGVQHPDSGSVAPGNGQLSGVSDHRIQPGGIKREGSWRKTAERNLDIIELAKKITAENRPATKDEQELLAKYTGFGASEIANSLFPGYAEYGHINEYRVKPEWKELVARVKEIFTPEELKTAARSTQYAHYTSEAVISSIYKALGRFGFKGGKVLEPGAGIGHFWGLMPDNMVGDSRYTSIEMDHLTATIGKLLYPNQDMMQSDFTKQALPGNFFDLGIGNPPFASTVITSDPDYKKNRFFLHDYFFAKTIDKVRPGGLLVFVTSKGTMDKADSKARAYLDERADLIGAIRLPQTAFQQNAGTEVVTDVLFMRKRLPTETKGDTAWLGLQEVSTPEGPTLINEYFAEHPEMILGTNSLKGSMYGANEYTVMPLEGDIEEHFAKAVEKLPADIYSTISTAIDDAVKEVVERDFNPKNKKEGGLYVSDNGEIMEVENGAGRAFSERFPKITAKEKAWLADYIVLRDAIKQAQYDQLHDLDWEKSLKELNRIHEAFVKKNGYVLDHTVSERVKVDEEGEEITSISKRYKNRLYREDAESPLIAGIEKELDGGMVGKGDFLTGRTIQKPVRQKPKSIGDSMALVLDETGTLNLGMIAEKMDMSRDEAIEALGDQIYMNHASGVWETRDEYLSGDVVKKLSEAEIAAKSDEKFRRNVDALRESQPAPLAAKDVSVSLGAPWVDAKIVQAFANEVLDAGVRVSYNQATNSWHVENNGNTGGKQSSRRKTTDWGTSDRGPNEILDAVLNNRSIKITRTTEDKKTVTDTTATATVNDLAKKMRAKFSSWVWEDAGRAGELLAEYNRRYNNLAPRAFNGDHLTLPGVSIKFKLHAHQKRAIWRAIQTGNTYLAHAVGSGKTIEMIAAGMEMKRLGLIQKPMYVVPKHMLQQFSNEFLELYPLANLMIADEENFHTDNRKRFMAQAALNSPDAIIVTHPSLGKVGVTEESVAPVRESMIDDLRASLEDLEDDKTGNRILIKKVEKRIEQLEQMFDSMLNGNKDQAITFEEMGVDFMFVDEAHEFRKLDFVTNRKAKGIDSNGSRKAIDLYIKTKALEAKRPGRSHIFASGTPVTNTMGELYTLMRFFAEKQMDADGIHHFDAWASMFGEISAGFERNAAGNYETVERFSTFVNVPELMKRIRTFMDVLTSSDLGATVKRPDIEGGHPQMQIAPQSEEMKAYMRDVLQPRIERSKKWKPSKEQPGNPDPIINIITDGRLASIDMRYVDNSAKSDPKSKLNMMIDGIIDTYKKNKNNTYLDPATGKKSATKGAAQIVFYNNGFGDGVKNRRGFDARAWMMKRFSQAIIPTSKVAWIDDYATAAKKEQLFKKVRNGEVRILIGSAKKMGTGMNVQNRLHTLHYLDPPWYPSDVEQPLGRIIRQGNQHETVNVNWYATEGSYDSTMWQMVARKSKFIEQALSGDNSIRKMEDTSEVSSYEMASALASGDVRVIQLAGLNADIERYERLRSAHFSDQHSLKAKLSNTRFDIKNWTKRIDDYSEAIKTVGGYQKEVTGTVGKKTFTKRDELGEALGANLAKIITNGDEGTFEVGKVNGFTVVVQVKPVGWRVHVVVTKEIKPDIEVSLGAESGLATRVINQLNNLDSKKRELASRLEEAEIELRKIEKRLGAPFEYGAELHSKIAEAAALENELVAEGKTESTEDSDTVPLLSQQSAPTSTGNTTANVESELRDFLGSGFDNMVRRGKLKIVRTAEGLPGNVRGMLKSAREIDHRFLSEGIRKARFVYNQSVAEELSKYGWADKVLETWFNYTKDDDDSSWKDADRLDMTGSELAEKYKRDIGAQVGAGVNVDDLVKFSGEMSGRLRDFLEVAVKENDIISFQAKKILSIMGTKSDSEDYSKPHLNALYSKSGTIVGAYDKATGKVYLVADAIYPGEAQDVFLHEAAHALLSEDPKFQQSRTKILDDFDRMGKLNPAIKAAIAKVPMDTALKDGEVYKELTGKRKDEVDDIRREEGLSYFIQNPLNRKHSIFKRIIAAVKAALFRMGIPVGRLNKADLVALFTQGTKAWARQKGTAEESSVVGDMSPVLLSQIEAAKAIYSKLAEVSRLKFIGMKAQGVANFLNKNGVKKEEMVAVGLNEWLAGKKPTDKVTREELMGFVQANAVEVERTSIATAEAMGGRIVKGKMIAAMKYLPITADTPNSFALFAKKDDRANISENTGEYGDNGDVRHSVRQESPTSLESVQAVAKTFTERYSAKWQTETKPDTSMLNRILQTPEYYFKKVAALKKMLDIALNRRQLRFEKEHEILGTEFIKFASELQKNDKASYEDADDYMVNTDQTGHAFRIKDTGELWLVVDRKGKEIGEYRNEQDAIDEMMAAERDDLLAQGYSENAAKAVYLARQVLNEEFNQRVADMRKISQTARENGLPDPFVSNENIDEAGRYGVYDKKTGKAIALFGSMEEANEKLEQAAEAISYVVVTAKGDEHFFTTHLRAKKWAERHTGTIGQRKRFGNLEVRKRKDAEMRPLTVSQAIAQMGDLRGSYFPRIRPSGEYVMIAKKAGANPIREHFDIPVAGKKWGAKGAAANWTMGKIGMVFPNAARRMRELKLQGYEVEFKKDDSPADDAFDATKLISSIDAILTQSMGMVDKNDSDEVKAAVHIDQLLTMEVADVFKGRGALSSRMKRLDGNTVWEGYETDMLKAIVQSARDTAAGIAKRETAKGMLQAFTGRDYSWNDYKADQEEQKKKPNWEEYQQIVDDRRVDPGKQKNAFRDGRAFMIDVLRNSEHADRVMGMFQGLAVVKFLGFRVSSAAVNATNMLTGVVGTISGKTGEPLTKSMARVATAANRYNQYLKATAKHGNLVPAGAISDEDRNIFQTIHDHGWDEAQFNHEAAGVLISKGGEMWNRFTDLSMKMFGAVERANRAMTIYAAYQAVKAANPSMGFAEAMEEAHDISNRAHGVYGKETLPAWARGKFNPMRLAYTFKKFSHNYVMNMVDLGVNEKEYKAAAYLLLSPAILGGAGATLAAPALFALAGALGIGGDDPEEEFYKWAEQKFGAGTFARQGIAGMAGVNLKGSLEVNIPMPSDIGKMNAFDLLGPAGGVVSDVGKSVGYFAKGEVAKGAESLLPTAFGSMSKAFREAREGISTGNYGTVFYGDEPLKADAIDATLRFFSFNPARLSGIREKQWNEKEVAAKYQERKTEIYRTIKRIHMQGKPHMTPETLKEIAMFNDLARRAGRVDIRPITPKGIRNMLKRNARPNRLEKSREISLME